MLEQVLQGDIHRPDLFWTCREGGHLAWARLGTAVQHTTGRYMSLARTTNVGADILYLPLRNALTNIRNLPHVRIIIAWVDNATE